MSNTMEIEHLSREEKLRIMEALGEDPSIRFAVITKGFMPIHINNVGKEEGL